MTDVILHVYDVTNTGSVKTNNTITQINKIFKDRIGLGGIFHSAVQVYGDEEWSFGFCEHGTGVFSCPPSKNPMYTYRECIILGKTNLSIFKVKQILRELSREWPGNSYDLLSKNCNHFCDEFCERLGVSKLPGWVNRFANAGDTAMEVAGNTALRWRQAKTEIVSASKVAYRFLAGVGSNTSVTPESPGNSNRGSPRLQASWFRNIISSVGHKPSDSELQDQAEGTLHQQQQPTEGTLHQWQQPAEGTLHQQLQPIEGTLHQQQQPAEGTLHQLQQPTEGTLHQRQPPTEGALHQLQQPTEGALHQLQQPTEQL